MRALGWLCAAALAAFTTGCDVGPHDEQPAHGPALHLVATYPADGQGTNTGADAGVDCDMPTPDCALPTNLDLELRFDRFLLPNSGLGAGLSLFTGDAKANAVSLSARYDLIERVVVFHPLARLEPNTLYTAQVVPGQDPGRGFWAFDSAPLEAGPVPLTFSFTTGSGPSVPLPPVSTTTDDCQTIVGPLSTCQGCHRDPPPATPTAADAFVHSYAPMGLVLTDWGIAHTAINRVAHETETGDSALDPGLVAAPRFGVQMNLIDPGSPENSYLMYKLLRKQQNYELGSESCFSPFHPPVLDGACEAPDDAELARLREWFVLGDPMPKDTAGSMAALSHQQLVRVANWISAGASCGVP